MRVGLIVNPYAGLGGPFALKGSDGALADQALASGGKPMATQRTARALSGVAGLDILTLPGAMGETAAQAAGQPARVLGEPAPARSSAADTVIAARRLCDAGVDLLLFAGGDGTARDLLGATGNVPVLGVPAGVKMHSAVFANSPAAAAAMLHDFARGRPMGLQPAEVIDSGAGGKPVLHGHLPAPQGPRRQAAHRANHLAADPELGSACIHLAHELADCPLALIGQGATMLAVKQALAGDGTRAGIDAYAHGRLIARDADEQTLWQLVSGASQPVRLALGVVGGQGFLLGRGNQQLSPRILARIGSQGITVLASADTLAALDSGRLLVDTGDETLDQQLAGHIGVRTGPRRRMVMMVEAA